LKTEYNLNQITLEKREATTFNLHKNYKIEKEFSNYWFQRLKFISKVIASSLIHGVIKSLIVRSNIDFRDVVNEYINKNDRQKQLSSIRSLMSEHADSELFENIYNCYMVINVGHIALYQYIGSNKPLAVVDLKSIVKLTFDCN
jgi:hypothetical protein